jgi:hypothetical protein
MILWDPCGRNDSREGNLTNKQVTFLQIELPDRKTINLHETLTNFNAQFTEFPKNLNSNICALYMLEFDSNLEYKPIDEKIFCLGGRHF